MPILKSEPSQYPEELFEEDFLNQTEDLGRKWWAVYTMSKKEKEFMRRLAPKQVPFYCPIIAKDYRSPQGRKRTSYIPLFSNYVFVYADETERAEALKTNCISKCLEVREQSQLVHDLRQVQLFISRKVPLTPEARLIPGELVRVKTGPFTGTEGIVFQRKSRNRLLVNVKFLQAGASIEINDWDLEKIGDAPKEE